MLLQELGTQMFDGQYTLHDAQIHISHLRAWHLQSLDGLNLLMGYDEEDCYPS